MPRRIGSLPASPPLDLSVVGHVNLDRFLLAPHLPVRDRTVPLNGQRLCLGGTAGNIARVAAGQGLRVGLSAGVGGDFPPAFRRLLQREQIDLRGLRTVRGGHTPSCFIVEDGRGGQMTLIDQGVFADSAGFTFDPGPVRRAAFAHLTTGPPEALLALADRLHGGPRLAADPAQEIHYRWDRSKLRRLLGACEVLFGNEAELRRAAKLLGLSGPKRLVEQVPLVIGTLGPDGSVAFRRGGTDRMPAREPRRIQQVTGAGDAFRGGFYLGWCGGLPVRECLAMGGETAARWIEGNGSLATGEGKVPAS
ncbi:MAG: PfkB family carbohydrate kinase [Thermoplasmata archaeon]|nr:PfkB family carbohydrate kinase [Thermoplasmata archaeon]